MSDRRSDILKSHARAVFDVGVRAVEADRLLEQVNWTTWAPRRLDAYDGVRIVGMGKASMAMAGAVESRLGDLVEQGTVVVPYGYRTSFPDRLPRPQRIEVIEAGHPVPDANSVTAARRILEEAAACPPTSLLLVLVSGGGSSLCADFGGAITLQDAQETFRLLLASGADIHAINTVRRQLSRIGGGRLAAAAEQADVLALVVSDVVGDDLTAIASGPTVPDATHASDALKVLEQFALLSRVPQIVRAHLNAATRRNPVERADVTRVKTHLLGTNQIALEAAAAEARRRGFDAEIVSNVVTGEAAVVGKDLARLALQAEGGRCLLWGGETTVTLEDGGKGGRNQELALAAALELSRSTRSIAFLSGGTDGRDGPTDAAGAVATQRSTVQARGLGLDPEDYLRRHDSYSFWNAMDDLVVTGPTHTNVMDIQVAVTAPD